MPCAGLCCVLTMNYLILFYPETVLLTQMEMGPQYTIPNASQLQPMLPKFKLRVRLGYRRQNTAGVSALGIFTEGKAWWKAGDSILWPLSCTWLAFNNPETLKNHMPDFCQCFHSNGMNATYGLAEDSESFPTLYTRGDQITVRVCYLL